MAYAGRLLPCSARPGGTKFNLRCHGHFFPSIWGAAEGKGRECRGQISSWPSQSFANFIPPPTCAQNIFIAFFSQQVPILTLFLESSTDGFIRFFVVRQFFGLWLPFWSAAAPVAGWLIWSAECGVGTGEAAGGQVKPRRWLAGANKDAGRGSLERCTAGRL